MTDIFFRPATVADEALIDRHITSSRVEASSYRGSTTDDRLVGDELAFVAGMSDVVLGSVIAVRTADGSARIRHLFVEPDAREVGIGDRLVGGLLQELRRVGCHWVGGVALPGDRHTKNLFERHGLVAQSIIVGRKLSDSSTEADVSR